MFDLYKKFEADMSLVDRRAVFALVYAAVGLSCIYYLKNPEVLASFLGGTQYEAFGHYVAYSNANNLPGLAWWMFVTAVFYIVLPAATVKLIFGERLSAFGLSRRVERGFSRILAQCLAVMLPLVYLMSLTSEFAAKYPFLKVYNNDPYLGAPLLIWETIYFLQFFGIEFFFRGFLLHSLRPALGIYSIFVMTIPYTMIHFGKPMPEVFAAVFAGIFLGWLSYRNRTIWLGLVLHCAVALSMDILALFNKGLIF